MPILLASFKHYIRKACNFLTYPGSESSFNCPIANYHFDITKESSFIAVRMLVTWTVDLIPRATPAL